MKEFMSEYGYHLILMIMTGIVSYLGLELKKIFANYYNSRIKREEAQIVYNAIHKMNSNLTEEEKLTKEISCLQSILKEKNIFITDLEATILLEHYGVINNNNSFNSE